MNQAVAEGKFNERGMLQLAPVPGGTYTLEVLAPGFAPAQFEKVPIYETRETILRFPIELKPPLTIHFSVQPPHDAADSAWRLTVLRADPLTFRHTTVAEATPADGMIEIGGQPPGRYTVRVQDHNYNWFVNREYDIQTPADSQRTIDVTLIHLRGKVVAGDHPLAAQIFFGGHSGAQRVAATSDDSGKFAVVLPRAGKWTIEVESKAESVAAAVTKTIAADQDELEIALPNTEVAGWVKGPDANRVAGAIVSCYTNDGPMSQVTSPDGTFRFRGVSTGLTRLAARDGRTGERSRIVEVTLDEGGHREDVEMQLENMRTLNGKVLAEGAPIAGARVNAYEFDGTMAHQERSVTNLDGGFELRVGRSVTQITLIVAAAGRPLHAFSTTPTDTMLPLELATVGGGLRLRMPHSAAQPAVTYNGTLVPLTDLLEWARAQGSGLSGETLDVPNVAPGLYAFCVIKDGAKSCKDGRLAPSAVLTLSPE